MASDDPSLLALVFRKGGYLEVQVTGTTTLRAKTRENRTLKLTERTPLAAAWALTIPAEVGDDYVVWNATSKTVTLKVTAGGATVDLAAGEIRLVIGDGSGFRGVGGGASGGTVLSTPPKTGWSWLNQGSATVDESGAAIVLATPAEAHYNLRVRKRAFAANKRVVAAFAAWNALDTVSSGFPEVGVGWTDGTKFITVSSVLVPGSGWFLEVHKFNTATSLNTAVSVRQHPSPLACWIKLYDDATDRVAYLSPDEGTTWREIYRETRTTFLTATEHVFLAGGGGSLATTGVLRSWAED